MQAPPLVIRPAVPPDVDFLTALAMRSKASHGYDEAFMKATGWSPSGSIPGRMLPRMQKLLD